MFSGGFRGTKLKTNLRLSINRLKLLEKKKTEMAQKARKEIADYIAGGKDERARIRVEHIIREDYLVEAMELLELYCDLLLARFGLIESQKTLDDGLAESISTIIWAAPRMKSDVQEIGIVAHELIHKYGKEYGKLAQSNETGTVNERFMLKLSPKPPPKVLVERYLMEIARSHNIPYEPDLEILDSADMNPLTADDLLLLDDTPGKPPSGMGGPPAPPPPSGGGFGGPPPPSGGGFGGPPPPPGGSYGGPPPPGGGYGGPPPPGGGFGGYGGGAGGGGGSAPMVPSNAVPSIGPPNPNIPFAYPPQQNAPAVPPPPAQYSPPPTSKKGGPPPLPGRPPAASAPPPSYNGEVSRNMTPAPTYEDSFKDSVYPPPGPGGVRPNYPSAPAPTPPPPPAGFPEAGPLPSKDAAAAGSIPDLPAVPTNSLPALDNTVGSQSNTGDDVDFDDLTRRFEELKKRK